MTAARSRAVWAFTIAIGAVASAGAWVGVRPLVDDGGRSAPLWFLLLAACFLAAELCVVHLRLAREAYAFSFMEVPLVLGLFFVRPDVLVLSRLAGAGLAFVLQRKDPQKAAFNTALFALETIGAVLVWHAVLAGADPLGPRGWLATGAAVLLTSVLGSTLVSGAITIVTGEWPRSLGEVFSYGQLGDLANACFALVGVYILSVDWRAGWLLGVVALVLLASYRASEAARQRSENLAQVNRFTEVVGRGAGLSAVVEDVLDGVGAAVRGGRVELRLDAGDGVREWVGADGKTSEAPASLIAALREHHDADGALLVARHAVPPALVEPLRDAGVRDCLLAPLRSENRLLGTLVVADRLGDVDSFGQHDLRLLQSLANHAALALDNALRSQQLVEQAEERERIALHDELTGLPNRRLFSRRLDEVLAQSGAAVVLLDLDGFKRVNDTLGHEVGDRLLSHVAGRLADAAGSAVVARFGGDEFAVLLPGAEDLEARACASVLRDALARPFDLDGIPVAVDASFGVATAEVGDEAVAVLRRADLATYTAKDDRTGLAVYAPELDRQDASRLGLLADLRTAIATDRLGLVYQPQYDVATGGVAGVEALSRWVHPHHGSIGPDEFIPLAEHSSLITPLTMAVLRRSLRDCAELRSDHPELTVAVNISPRSLLTPTFVDEVAGAIAASGLPPSALVLEITETSLMTDPDRAVDALLRLRGLGIGLSVDDLGTGYSSLAYLQRLPVDEIKIDRSFFTDLDRDARAVVAAIVDLGHRLGRRVVAEGVEDDETLEVLRVLGCDLAQGFGLCRPAPFDEVRRRLGSTAATTAPPSSLRLIR